MTDMILHHYPNSPFSEKVRIAFGVKKAAWKSVVIPNMLPKPARANRPIFYARSGRRSKSLSVAEVHRKIEQAMGLRLDRYRNVTDSVPTATAYR